MAVGILMVTHAGAGRALLEAARATLGGELPLAADAFSVPLACDPDATARDLRDLCRKLDRGDGVLILTDLYGSTPCNVSTDCRRDGAVHVVSGVNLSMLIKVMNYHSLDLAALTAKALAGGRGGVRECGR